MTDADRARRPARLLPAVALAAAGAATALALVAAARRLRALDPRLTRTMFGPALTYATAGPDGDAVRVLSVGGAFQSAAYLDGRPDAPFAYLRAFDAMLDAGVPVRRVLMLGGGAFAYPRHLLARRPDVRLDAVSYTHLDEHGVLGQVDELVLERRASGVQGEDLHDALLSGCGVGLAWP